MPKAVLTISARTFCGVHFFNPPRYLHLVELIRTEWTKPEVSCFLFGFLDQRLGKGVVPAKDRPNFIANRIGTFGALLTIKTMLEDGYSIEEVDKMTGPAVGRPKTATFRTFDLVGLDVFSHVIKNLYEALPDDDQREMFVAPEFLTNMVERGLLGNKTKGGFYKKQKGEGDKQEIWTLETASLDYRPSQKVKLPALDMAKNIEETAERIKTLVWGKDRVGGISLEDALADACVMRQREFRKSLTRLLKLIARCAGVSTGSWDRLKFGTLSALRSRSPE